MTDGGGLVKAELCSVQGAEQIAATWPVSPTGQTGVGYADLTYETYQLVAAKSGAGSYWDRFFVGGKVNLGLLTSLFRSS